MLGASLHQPRAEVAEDGEVEADVRELQPEQVFPGQAVAHGVGGLPVAQPLGKLEDRDQRQAPGRLGRAPLRGKQRSEARIIVDGPQLIPQTEVAMPLGEGRTRDAHRLLRDRTNGLRT